MDFEWFALVALLLLVLLAAWFISGRDHRT